MANRRKGFTLAELLIVVAIVGVLVAVSIPVFTSQLEKSKQATDLANMRSAKAAAIAEWMSDGMPVDYTRKYDASSGTMTDSAPTGYGKSSKAVTAFDTVMEGASGVPNSNGKANYITVKISEEGLVTLNWNGIDLSTPEGKMAADKQYFDNGQAAAIAAYNSGTLNTSSLKKTSEIDSIRKSEFNNKSEKWYLWYYDAADDKVLLDDKNFGSIRKHLDDNLYGEMDGHKNQAVAIAISEDGKTMLTGWTYHRVSNLYINWEEADEETVNQLIRP